METINAKKIETNGILNLHFLNQDVLENFTQKEERKQKLAKGAVLGNIEKVKCKIIFQAKEGNNYIETTIWAVTDKYLCLKGGIALSIASILEVIL